MYIKKSPKKSPIPDGDGPQIPVPALDFLSGDMKPSSGNTLIFSNKGVENLKALNYIYSIRKA